MKKNRDNEEQREGTGVFRHYRVMVKILQDEKVEYQNLEIFTTGLPQLLELRRIHNQAMHLEEYRTVIENPGRN